MKGSFTNHQKIQNKTIILDTEDPKKIEEFKKEYEKYKLIPIYLDPEIVDMTRLWKRFGNLIKKFSSYEEMSAWLKKARKLNPEWKGKL